MKTQALVLLSGGLDSVYNLYRAQKIWPGAVSTLFFHYGQKASVREQEASRYYAQMFKAPWRELDLEALFAGGRSALTSDQQGVPTSEVNIQSHGASLKTAAQVWVPNRNGVFLNVAAAVAETQEIPWIVPGFNREEASTFPDNSVEFIEATNHALQLSTLGRVQIQCFSQDLDKIAMVKELLDGEILLDRIWSCYLAQEKACGQCESCQRLARARDQQTTKE